MSVEVVGVDLLKPGDVYAVVVKLSRDRIFVFEGVAAAPDVVARDGECRLAASGVDAALRVELGHVGHRQTGNKESSRQSDGADNVNCRKKITPFHNFLLNSIVLQNGAVVNGEMLI